MPKPAPPPTKTLHVPPKLHQTVAVLAARRRESMQETASKALAIGLRGLRRRAAADAASTN